MFEPQGMRLYVHGMFMIHTARRFAPRLFIYVSLCLSVCASVAATPVIEGLGEVRDGDSLRLAGLSLRLFGIDAPERGQDCDLDGEPWPCGIWAQEVLTRATAGQTLHCLAVETDRYGRTVATCQAEGRDLGSLMVISGAASAYTRYSGRYLPKEALARAAGRGIWGGQMVAPSAYRAVLQTPAALSCTIKGNISAHGRIFHLPGQRDYAGTRITPGKGEAWFCSIPEARAAGFRPAAR